MIQLIKDTDLGYAKDVDAEKFEGKRRKGQQRMSWLDPLALFVVMLPKAHLTSQSRMSGSR